jgi:hypothetical protein
MFKEKARTVFCFSIERNAEKHKLTICPGLCLKKSERMKIARTLVLGVNTELVVVRETDS